MSNTGMKLDKLRALRDEVPVVELPIPTEELLTRYETLYTGAVSDVLREMTLLDQCLPYMIMPLRDDMKVAGIAFTIRSNVDPTTTGEMETRADMLGQMHDHAIVIWNANGEDYAAHWGEVMTATSKSRGCRGAIIDGGIRDTVQVLAQNFPIWYRYRTPNGSLARCKITGYQVPIQVGNVIIRPGDIIFADIDGVVIIPRVHAYDVLVRAEEIRSGEKVIRQWVDDGVSAEEIVDRGGYF